MLVIQKQLLFHIGTGMHNKKYAVQKLLLTQSVTVLELIMPCSSLLNR